MGIVTARACSDWPRRRCSLDKPRIQRLESHVFLDLLPYVEDLPTPNGRM
jgi:hypothetical protein